MHPEIETYEDIAEEFLYGGSIDPEDHLFITLDVTAMDTDDEENEEVVKLNQYIYKGYTFYGVIDILGEEKNYFETLKEAIEDFDYKSACAHDDYPNMVELNKYYNTAPGYDY